MYEIQNTNAINQSREETTWERTMRGLHDSGGRGQPNGDGHRCVYTEPEPEPLRDGMLNESSIHHTEEWSHHHTQELESYADHRVDGETTTTAREWKPSRQGSLPFAALLNQAHECPNDENTRDTVSRSSLPKLKGYPTDPVEKTLAEVELDREASEEPRVEMKSEDEDDWTSTESADHIVKKGGHRVSLRDGRWKGDEHARFLEGFRLHGNKWKRVQDIVKTRTVTQVRTHAQKYLLKLAKQKGNPPSQPSRGPIPIKPRRSAASPTPCSSSKHVVSIQPDNEKLSVKQELSLAEAATALVALMGRPTLFSSTVVDTEEPVAKHVGSDNGSSDTKTLTKPVDFQESNFLAAMAGKGDERKHVGHVAASAKREYPSAESPSLAVKRRRRPNAKK